MRDRPADQKKTIQNVVDAGEAIRAHCHNWECRHSAELDMLALREKFGGQAYFMASDVEPWLRCTKCGGRRAGIICTPSAKQYGPNPYAKAKGG